MHISESSLDIDQPSLSESMSRYVTLHILPSFTHVLITHESHRFFFSVLGLDRVYLSDTFIPFKRDLSISPELSCFLDFLRTVTHILTLNTHTP